MTFLQLCQRLRAECQDIGTGPASVLSSAPRDQIYIQAIREAWLEIQLSRPDWTFWPDDLSYTLNAPQSLTDDADTPFIPAQYHIAIVYFALTARALANATPELVEKAAVLWPRYYNMLLDRYTGTIAIGEAPLPVYDDSGYSVGEVLAN